MNIYIHVEVSVRELDSKLLLAVISAKKGHKVLISDLPSIRFGINNKILAPGIFHTKSLSPSEIKILRHQEIIDSGSIISSIDEEGGLVDYGYDKFAKSRYSKKTIDQASIIFGWGAEDVESLKRIYPDYSSKIFMTGSPRSDLWKPLFNDYWRETQKMNKKNFILVPTNFSLANSVPKRPFHRNFELLKRGGYFERDPDYLNLLFGTASEEYQMILSFINALKYLSKNSIGYDIVIRPHPAENIEAWRIYLKDLTNVYVSREGPIDAWVRNSFAIIHHDCTTGIEATICGKPVITYNPFNRKFNRKLANDIGHSVTTLEELLNKTNSLFEKIKTQNKKSINEKIPESISRKIFSDENELAAEKMVQHWEKFSSEKLNKTSDWMDLKWKLKILNFKGKISNTIKKLYRNDAAIDEQNPKFQDFKLNEIIKKIDLLKRILNIDNKIECKLISNKSVLIKKF